MPALPTNLRRDLERTVVKARDVAEAGARQALEALTVHEGKAGGHLDAAGRKLRNQLRAHGRQLGDRRDAKSGSQTIDRLVREMAYEHWHRMLFARFLAENDLLVEPTSGVSVSLDEVEELAREAGANPWELASRYAQGALPQIFRPDDPVLAVELATETRLQLERLLEALPRETFLADDSLGWVYQFWQSKRKDEVNASGEKITGDTLPAVTQLFTEHYMVLFLLHNTLGAWHAGKVAGSGQWAVGSEEEARRTVAIHTDTGDCPWTYLRFVQDDLTTEDTESTEEKKKKESGEDTKPQSSVSSVVKKMPWRPAAGTFEGWPREAKDLRVLDPCCGSGHFLVAAFKILVRLRMHEERLSVEEAVAAVLRENLFGLEIDQRCVQLAAFNVALAAWTMVGRRIELPELHIACSGIGPSATEDEWIKLAEQSGKPFPRGGAEPIRDGLRNLHSLFTKAPTLGSLIDPSQLTADLITADYETLLPYLTAALAGEKSNDEVRERAIAAAGMVKAAELLAGDYTLVITNVPYLGRGKQDDTLKSHLEKHFKTAKADLATAFVVRCLEQCERGGSTALVTPQNWLFLTSYKKLREELLKRQSWNTVARLGPGAFETIGGHVVNVALLTLSAVTPDEEHIMAGIDALDAIEPKDKADQLRHGHPTEAVCILQAIQLENPDAIIKLESSGKTSFVGDYASCFAGILNGDSPKFRRQFWEFVRKPSEWVFQQSTVDQTRAFGGMEGVIFFDEANGHLREDATIRRERLHDSDKRGNAAWGKCGIAISQMHSLPVALYKGNKFDASTAVLYPEDQSHVPALWCYCSNPGFSDQVRKVNQKVSVENGYFEKLPFDLAHWQEVAAEKYPNGLPEPESDDPTQWLFHGRPEEAEAGTELQVAVARLMGYRWPAELDDEMRLSDRARALVARCDELLPFADDDGIVCIPSLRSEETAAERVRKLLAAAYGDAWSADKEAELLAACDCAGMSLDQWLREKIFEQHVKLFHHRPFVWHIWDGKKDGFHALVNYHKLCGKGESGKEKGAASGRKVLESLTYSYLGDWITRQQAGVKNGEPGAEGRLAAAETLKRELENILTGEPPYDLFIRWKPLDEQPIGWQPDINDGVRLNIRPFMLAKDVGRKGAGILRFKPNCKWKKDRGKEPKSLRPKEDFPWFWSWDEQTQDFTGGTESSGKGFDANRWNDLHYTNEFKQAARERDTRKDES